MCGGCGAPATILMESRRLLLLSQCTAIGSLMKAVVIAGEHPTSKVKNVIMVAVCADFVPSNV
jgi:hypothetical protein